MDRSHKLRNAYGEPVEEYEIQFIDGEAVDCALAKAVGIHQGSIKRFIEISNLWGDDDKLSTIIAVGECGYAFDLDCDDPDRFAWIARREFDL